MVCYTSNRYNIYLKNKQSVVRYVVFWLLFGAFKLTKYFLSICLNILLFEILPLLPLGWYSTFTFGYLLIKCEPASPNNFRIFEKYVNWYLFFFVTIPRWFFHEFIKVFFIYIKKSFKFFFFKYVLFATSISLIPGMLYTLSKYLRILLIKLLKIFKNILMDFLFFDVYQKRVKIGNTIVDLVTYCVYLYLLYLLVYINIWGLIFNYIFCNCLEYFIIWDVDSYKGILYISLWFMNLDNIFFLCMLYWLSLVYLIFLLTIVRLYILKFGIFDKSITVNLNLITKTFHFLNTLLIISVRHCY